MIADFEYVNELYPSVTLADYHRYGYDAERDIDRVTIGVDGRKKPTPTNEYDLEALKRCFAKLVYYHSSLEEIEMKLNQASATELVLGTVSSIHSGSESISFNGVSGELVKIAQDRTKAQAYFNDMAISELRGVKDANGINILYLGVYPNV